MRDSHPSNSLHVLVTGVTGLAGWAFVQEFYRQASSGCLQVEGLISRASRAPVFWPDSIPLCRGDLSTLADARHVVQMKRWHLIVHADRVCRLKFCEKETETARRINVQGTRNLVQAIAELPAGRRPRLVFCSTDHVFSGNPNHAPFLPDSTRAPITAYGKMMVEAEDIVSSLLEDVLIIRNGLLLGRGPLGTTGPIDWLQTRLREGKPATLFHNETRTPLGVRCLGRLGTQLALSPRRGVAHLCMKTRINRYDLGLKILHALGRNDLVHLVKKADRRHDSICRVQELVMEDPGLEAFRPKELDPVLEEIAEAGDARGTAIFHNGLVKYPG